MWSPPLSQLLLLLLLLPLHQLLLLLVLLLLLPLPLPLPPRNCLPRMLMLHVLSARSLPCRTLVLAAGL